MNPVHGDTIIYTLPRYLLIYSSMIQCGNIFRLLYANRPYDIQWLSN